MVTRYRNSAPVLKRRREGGRATRRKKKGARIFEEGRLKREDVKTKNKN